MDARYPENCWGLEEGSGRLQLQQSSPVKAPFPVGFLKALRWLSLVTESAEPGAVLSQGGCPGLMEVASLQVFHLA